MQEDLDTTTETLDQEVPDTNTVEGSVEIQEATFEQKEVHNGPSVNLKVDNELKLPFTKPFSNPRKSTEIVLIEIPRYTSETFRANFERFENQYMAYMEYQAKRPGSKINNWIGRVVDSSVLIPEGDALRGAVNRENADWGKRVTVGNESISAAIPVVSTNARKLEGAAGLTQAKSLMGLVGTINVPLYHSGVWITFQTPSASEDLNLNDILAEAKDEIGYLTNGLIFSADSYMLQRHVVDHALKHAVDCSVANVDTDWYYDNLLITDIPLMIWGIACATWPSGFGYSTPCINNPTKCNYVHEEILNLRRLNWTDRNALTDRQKLQLAKRLPNRYTNNDVEQYQRDHKYLTSPTCIANLTYNTRVVLSVPKIRKFITCGDIWLERIKRVTEASLRKDMTKAQRANLMLQQGEVTTLQQFAHFVDRIEINKAITADGFDEVLWDEENTLVYDDVDHIADLLAEASANKEVYKNFMDAVQKFQNEVVVSMIAIPTFNCPECGDLQTPIETPHPDLVPLEVARIFFTLVAQRIAGLLARQ